MPRTLLLGDDNVTIQRFIELTFADHEIKVVSVGDGQEAIERLRTDPPDIVLAAASLPRVDGYNIARFVRQEPRLQRIPVLILTGAFDAVDEHHVRESGASGVLNKPFEPAVVINRVKELLGMGKTPERPSTAGRLVTPPSSPASSAPSGPPRPQAPEGAPVPNAGAAAPPAEPTSAEGPGRSGGDYFGHLDAAFDSLDAQLAGRPAAVGTQMPASAPQRLSDAADPGQRPHRPGQLGETAVLGARAGELPPNPVFEVDSQWFGKTDPPHAQHPDEDPQAAIDTGRPLSAPAAHDPAPPPAAHAPAAPGQPAQRAAYVAPASDGVADVFAALLEAEEHGESMPRPAEPMPLTAPLPPIAMSHAPAPVELSEEIIERIAQRVAERLQHGMIGYTVTKVVSETSERLVKQEIDRIRAAASRQP